LISLSYCPNLYSKEFASNSFTLEKAKRSWTEMQHKHVKRLKRLYEQQKAMPPTDEQVAWVLAEYVKRWQC